MAGIAPSHPGEVLKDIVLPALGRPKAEIARLLGVSRAALYQVLDAKAPMTTPMAMRVGKLCGNGPEIWLTLQTRFDVAAAETAMADALAGIPTLEAAGV
jgi:addiction module HigA family antidote